MPKVSEVEQRRLRGLGPLTEVPARLVVAKRALALGWGGLSRLAKRTGRSRPTISTGAVKRARQRRLEETPAGDPMRVLKWTSKSTRAIAAELTRRGHPVTWGTVARCLHDLGYSLQANGKTIEGPQHPDREAQFRSLNAQGKAFLRTEDPGISVDTKKQQLVGAFAQAGRTGRPRGKPRRLFTHDVPHRGAGKAIPSGTDALTQARALVNVGVTPETAECAGASLRRGWRLLGEWSYPHAARLLICADAGGSDGNRLRAWKGHLQELADAIGRPISVAHYPPGTSQGNQSEHRLCACIRMHWNWKRTPLVGCETGSTLIGSTRTRNGLQRKAMLDTREYETGQEVPPQAFQALPLHGHSFHSDWNSTLSPHTVRRSRQALMKTVGPWQMPINLAHTVLVDRCQLVVRQGSHEDTEFDGPTEQLFLPVTPIEPVDDLGHIRLQVLVGGPTMRPVDDGFGIGDRPMDLGTSLPATLGSWSTTLQRVQGHCELNQKHFCNND